MEGIFDLIAEGFLFFSLKTKTSTIYILYSTFSLMNPINMKVYLPLIFLVLFTACSNNDNDVEEMELSNSQYIIPVGKAFEWRLDNLSNNYFTNADVIDIDAFSATSELIFLKHREKLLLHIFLLEV